MFGDFSDNYDFLELNVPKEFKGKTAYTIKEVIALCEKYSNDGYELYFVATPYMVFRRKKPLLTRIKNYLKKLIKQSNGKE